MDECKVDKSDVQNQHQSLVLWRYLISVCYAKHLLSDTTFFPQVCTVWVWKNIPQSKTPVSPAPHG